MEDIKIVSGNVEIRLSDDKIMIHDVKSGLAVLMDDKTARGVAYGLVAMLGVKE